MRLRTADCRVPIAVVLATLALALAFPALAQQRPNSQDEYTLYELLAPESASFKIEDEVTAATPGATSFFNRIRKGSAARDEADYDMMTGAPLKVEKETG